MEWFDVKSSRLAKVAYSKKKGELVVIYLDGGTFLFEQVPHNFFLEMMLARSVGGYFFDNIRHSFPNRRLQLSTEEE